MNDKLQQIYDLYKNKGIISATDFNTFSSADESQRKQLYDLGVSKGLFKSTDYGTFNTAWGGSQPVKKKASSEDLVSKKATKGTSVLSLEDFSSVSPSENYNKKSLSQTSKTGQVFKGYPGKGDKEYLFENGRWYEDNSKKQYLEGQIKALEERKSGLKSIESELERKLSAKPIDKAIAEKKKQLSQSNSKNLISDPLRVTALNKHFGKEASTSPSYKTFVGYPGKEKNQYMISGDGNWMRKEPGQKEWHTLTDPTAVTALNRQFKQNVKVLPKDVAKKVTTENKIKTDFNRKIDTVITSKLTDDSEGNVVEKLNQQFKGSGFKFEEDQAGSDRVLVTAPNGRDKKLIVTDNWTWKEDKEAASDLKAFMRQHGDAAYSKAEQDIAESEGYFLTKDINAKQAALQAGSGQMQPEQRELKINTDGSVSYVGAEQLKQEKKKAVSLDIEERLKAPEVRREYMNQKAAQFDEVRDRYKTKDLSDDDLKYAYAQIKSDDKEIKRTNDFVTDINKYTKDYNKSKEFHEGYVEDIQSKLRSGEITMEQYEAEYKPKIEEEDARLKSQSADISKDLSNLPKVQLAMDKSVAQNFIIAESKGSIAGGMTYNFAKGLTDITRFFGVSKEEQDKMIREATGILTTEEFMNSGDRSDITKAMFSITESLGAGVYRAIPVVGQALTAASLYSMGYYELKDDLDSAVDENGDKLDISERDKIIMSSIYGTANAALERIGLDAVLGKSKIVNSVTSRIIKNAFKSIPRNASKEFIEGAINSSAKAYAANFATKAVITQAAEGVTEGAQNLAMASTKEVYDQLNKTDYFNNKSGWEIAKDAMYDSYLGALGAGATHIAIQAPQAIKLGVNSVYKKPEIEMLIQSAKTAGMDQALVTNLKASILKGKVSKEEAKDILNSFQTVQSKVESMTPNLSVDQQSVTLDLMLEKDRISKEIEGKDPNLVVVQKARIGEIDKQIQKIGEDAVQKQTTGEVPVQSETGVGEKVEGRIPETTAEQTAAEVVGEEVVGEEVKGEQAQTALDENKKNAIEEEKSIITNRISKMQNELSNVSKLKPLDRAVRKNTIKQQTKLLELLESDPKQYARNQLKENSEQDADGNLLYPDLYNASNNLLNTLLQEPLTINENSVENADGTVSRATVAETETTAPVSESEKSDIENIELKNNTFTAVYTPTNESRVFSSYTESADWISSKYKTKQETAPVAETAPSTESELDFEVTPEVTQEADALEKLLADEGITVEAPVTEEAVVEQPMAEEEAVVEEIPSQPVSEMPLTNVDLKSLNQEKINSIYEALPKETKEKYFPAGVDGIKSSRFVSNLKSALGEVKAIKAIRQETAPVSEPSGETGQLPVAEAKPIAKPKKPKKLTVKEIVQKYSDHIDSLIKDEKQRSDRRIVQLENQRNSAREERRKELNQEIENLKIDFIAKKISLEKKKNDKQAAKDFNENPARFRMSEGTQEQPDTRNDEAAIVAKMNEASAEEKGLTRGEVPESVEVNPIEESSSLSKGLDKVLKFLGLKDKNQLLKKIEDFNGIPMILGMSDMLAAGTIKDSMGGDMVVDGGLLYNTLGKNVGLAWAGVTEDGANNQVKQARELYEANKELFDRLWAEGKIPQGHVPMAIMRMGNTAVNSNEAVFRYLLPLVKSLPLKNRTAALRTYMQTLQSKAEGNAASYWFTELEEQMEMGNLTSKEQVLEYLKNLADEENKKNGESTKYKKIIAFTNSIKKNKAKGEERTFDDIREDLNERLDKIVPFMLSTYIKSNKIKTLDGFLEAVVNESKKRAQGDKNIFSLPVRSFIFNSLISPESTKGKNSLEVIKTLLDGVKNADATIFTAKHIYDAIGEKSMLKANQGDVVGIMGIKVVDENGNPAGGAKKAEHNNYGFGPEGKVIALIKNPKQGIDVFPEFRAKLARVFKPSKTGVYPKIDNAIQQTGGAFFIDSAFRGTAPAVDAMTDLKVLIGKLRFAFPEVSVATTQEEFDTFMEQEGIRAREKDGKVIYGVTKDGRIFLNPSEQTLRTPIHEFGHIWIDYLRSDASKKKGDMLLQKGFELVDGTPEYERALKEYGSRELALEEALVELLAVKGDTIASAAKKSQFLEWMNAMFKYIKENLTRSKDFAQTKIKDLTLDEFINIGLADLFSGQRVSGKFDARTAGEASRARFSKADNISKIVDIAAKNGVSNEAIKLLLARRGFSISDINAAIVKRKAPIQKGKVSKVTVNEKTALKDQIRFEARAAKEGAKSVSDAVKAITAFFKEKKNQGNLTRANLTSIINIISSVKDQKTLDAAADKIYNIVSSADSDIIEVSEYKMLKNQLRLEARAAREAKKDVNDKRKDLAKTISEMETTGKITTKQAQALMARISKLNMDNPAKVDAFVEYAGRVFENAEFAQDVARARSLQSKVRNNAKSKLGIANDLISEILKMASINPSLIPSKVFDTYMETMEMLGQRTTVLKLEDRGELTQKVADILDAVNEELSVASEMAARFEAYDNKEVDSEGKIDFAKTLDKMIADDTITKEDADIMRKYKSDIIDKESTKMTEEEIAEEKKTLLGVLKKDVITDEAIRNLPSELERKLANSIKSLLKTDAVNRLDNSTLKNLLKLVDNINNGFVPHYAQKMKERLTSIDNSPVLETSIKKGNPLKVSSFTSKVKALFTNRNYVLEMIRSVALANVDQVFGDFKTNNIFKTMFEGSAKGISAFNSELARVQDKLEDARLKVAKSLGQDPNKVTMSAFKTMTYLLQLEKESNPDSKQVNNAVDFINATIDQIEKGESIYTEMDAEFLQDILDKYTKEGQIDTNKLYNSFNSAEKAAIKTIQEVNDSMTEKAVYTAGIIRGDKINPIANYVPHVVLKKVKPGEDISGASDVANFSESREPSTKAKNLVERTGTVTAISFNPYQSTQNAAKNVLLDFHMTEPIRIARMTINETRKRLEEGKVTPEQRMFLNAISNAFEEATQNVLANSFQQNELLDKAVAYIAKAGYQAVLGTSVTRTASELLSNMSAVVLMNPAAFAEGVKSFSNFSNPEEGLDIMLNVGSAQTERVMGGNTQGGMLVDPSIMKRAVGMKDTKAKNKLASTMQMIYNRSIKKGLNATEGLSDILMSSPDMIVTRPTWFGSFATEFEKASGKKADFDKIKANDEAYMNENADAIKAAKEKADKAVFNLSATNNAYMGLLKNNISPDSKGITKAVKVFDNYLTRFTTYEYLNSRTAIYALAGNGMISKGEAIRLLAGVTTRMITYSLLTKSLSALLLSLVYGGDDEDDDKTFMQKLGQAAASAGTTLMLGRNFGNISRNIMGYGTEKMNEKYLTALREGDYDAYQDAIQYTVVPQEKKGEMGKGVDVMDMYVNMLGPVSPFVKSLVYGIEKLTEKDRVAPKESDSDAVKAKRKEAVTRQQRERTERVPLEIIGTLGYVPFYKDIRKAVNESIYSDLKKSLKEQEANKEKKAEMLMGYESKTDMEDSNPKLYERLYGEGGKYYRQEEIRLANENLKNRLKKIEKQLGSGEIGRTYARSLRKEAIRDKANRIKQANR